MFNSFQTWNTDSSRFLQHGNLSVAQSTQKCEPRTKVIDKSFASTQCWLWFADHLELPASFSLLAASLGVRYQITIISFTVHTYQITIHDIHISFTVHTYQITIHDIHISFTVHTYQITIHDNREVLQQDLSPLLVTYIPLASITFSTTSPLRPTLWLIL